MSAEGAGQVMASTASGRPPAVMVTGGAGLVGSHLVDRLVERGFRVVVVDDLSSGSRDNLHDHLDGAGGGEPRVVLVQHDVCQVIDDQLAGPHLVGADRFETVFHLASPASPPDYLSRPVHTLETGSLGTMHTLAVAERHRARYLLTSTSEVYGDPEVHPQPETYWGNVNPVGPRSVYDEAKRFAESLVTAHGRARGTDVRIVRLFNTYGPRMRPEDGRVVSNFVAQALAGRPLTIFGDGTQTRSFGFVDDTVAGILAVLESDLTTPVNVGNPAEFTMLELAGLVAELTGSASPGLEFLPLPEDDPVQRRPDITLVQRHTGWEPTVQLREGLERTISWMRTHLGHRLG